MSWSLLSVAMSFVPLPGSSRVPVELGDSYYSSWYLAGVETFLSGAESGTCCKFTWIHYSDSSACPAGFCQPLQSGPTPPSSILWPRPFRPDRCPGLTSFPPQKSPHCSPMQICPSSFAQGLSAPDFPLCSSMFAFQVPFTVIFSTIWFSLQNSSAHFSKYNSRTLDGRHTRVQFIH